MKRKTQQVFESIIKATGGQLSRFQAAECAGYLLRRNGGNVRLALEAAKRPFKIDGQFTY